MPQQDPYTIANRSFTEEQSTHSTVRRLATFYCALHDPFCMPMYGRPSVRVVVTPVLAVSSCHPCPFRYSGLFSVSDHWLMGRWMQRSRLLLPPVLSLGRRCY